MSMPNQELIKRMTRRLESKGVHDLKDVEHSVQTIIDVFTQCLADDNRIEIRGFGSFFLKSYYKRRAVNPRTGAQLELNPRKLPQFRISKALHNKLNEGLDC